MNKSELLNLIESFVNQRPGFDPCDYVGDYNAYRSDYRPVLKAKHTAQEMIWFCEGSSYLTVRHLKEALESAYGGRLSLVGDRLEYTAGQYFCTEFRNAACAVLGCAIWYAVREDLNNVEVERTVCRDDIMAQMKVIRFSRAAMEFIG